MKITLILTEPFVDPDGKVMEGPTMGRMLASTLAASNNGTGDALKSWNWAVTLSKSEPVELDDSDAKALEKFIQESATLTVLAKAQLLRVLTKARLEAVA